jgi:hypothetical protein
MSPGITLTTLVIAASLSLPGNALSQALLASWEFDAADVSGANVSATAGTAANTTGILQADATVTAGALALDGTGDYLQFGNDVSDLRSQDSLTIAVWVNTNSAVAALRRIIEHEDNNYFWAQDGAFQYTTHGTPGGGTTGRAVSSTAPAIGTWQHVLVSMTAGQPAKIYINGTLEGTSVNNQAATPANIQTLQFGCRRSSSGTPSNFWDGQMDDVGFWAGELPLSDIRALAGFGNSGYAGKTAPSELQTNCNGDRIPDSWYQQYGLDPCDANIGSAQSDADSWDNFKEFDEGTSPILVDTDGDDINDDLETVTDPTLFDTDGDGLGDGEEINTYMTDPNLVDSDLDGLSDGDEVLTHLTMPNKRDSDMDGVNDGVEIAAGTNPNGPETPMVAVSNGLLVYYSFDSVDVSGDTVSDTAGNAVGPFNGTKTNSGPTSASGVFGEAVEFAGGGNNSTSAHYIDMNSSAVALAALSSGSIAAWVKAPNDALVTDVLTIFAISDENDGSSESRWWVSNGGATGTGTLAYGVRDDGVNLGTLSSGSTNPLFDGAWHHVALTFDQNDGMARLYVDGFEKATEASAFFSGVMGANSASIGRNKDSTAGGGQWFFDGTMDDFAIWNRSLSAAEVATIYTDGLVNQPITPGTADESGFKITMMSYDSGDDTVSVTWGSEIGQNYSLDFSTDLINWEGIDETIATSVTTTLVDDFLNIDEPNAYYRIRKIP